VHFFTHFVDQKKQELGPDGEVCLVIKCFGKRQDSCQLSAQSHILYCSCVCFWNNQPIKMDVAAVSKECSQIWKSMPPEQRQYWDNQSDMEKQSYFEQKAAYQGPWRIATKKVKKMVCALALRLFDYSFELFGPNLIQISAVCPMQKVGAPKRSPSAFFLFVNANRPLLKERYPGKDGAQ
jgi:hypothetical protein